MRFSETFLCGLILGTTLILRSKACPTVECKRESRLTCEAAKGTFLIKNGFCYCCQLIALEGDEGVCDKKYCELTKLPVVTEDDCDQNYEEFKEKDVERCRCQNKCEPVWVKGRDGEKCGKALCALTVCPEILCGIDYDYWSPDACRCCGYCVKKDQSPDEDIIMYSS